MPSSTFGSEPERRPRAARAIWVLLLAIASILGATELLFRLEFDRTSKIQRRTVSEYRGAVGIRRGSSPGRLQLLVLGNSLLLEGVEFPGLSRDLRPEIEARRFVVDNTSYLDWYYGIRSLLRRGARPDVVALALSPLQLVVTASRGDYVARYLYDARDVIPAARAQNASPTVTANLVFAHFSEYYAVRSEFRKWFLVQIVPDLSSLGSLLVERDTAPLEPRIREKAAERLRALRGLTEKYGVGFVLVVMPRPGAPEGIATLQARAEAAGARVLVPPGEYAASDFKDGFHLNAQGAARFTSQLAISLRQELLGGTSAVQPSR
jgi:hypothetical protein